MPALKAVLFDLDGTLTDSFLGITNCFRYALERMGELVPEAEALRWCLGPPLHDSFAKMVGEARVEEAVAFYRERYASIGCFECSVYDGVPEMLAALAEYELHICTSKADLYVPRILERVGLAPLIGQVFGATYDGSRSDKGEIIALCLESTGLKPEECLMVGDRKHDVLGAASCGLPCIGAGWGFGVPGELESAGALAVAQTPQEVVEIVGRRS